MKTVFSSLKNTFSRRRWARWHPNRLVCLRGNAQQSCDVSKWSNDFAFSVELAQCWQTSKQGTGMKIHFFHVVVCWQQSNGIVTFIRRTSPLLQKRHINRIADDFANACNAYRFKIWHKSNARIKLSKIEAHPIRTTESRGHFLSSKPKRIRINSRNIIRVKCIRSYYFDITCPHFHTHASRLHFFLLFLFATFRPSLIRVRILHTFDIKLMFSEIHRCAGDLFRYFDAFFGGFERRFFFCISIFVISSTHSCGLSRHM